MPLTPWWEQKRQSLTGGMLTAILIGKGLALIGIGALLAPWIRPWAWGLIVVGLTLDGATKWRWLRRRAARAN